MALIPKKMWEKFTPAVNFFTTIINKAKNKLNVWTHHTPPPPTTGELVSAEAGRNMEEGNDAQRMMWMQWRFLVLGLCFAAVSAALQALQMTGPLPFKSQLVCMILVIFFTTVMASIYLRSNYERASDFLLHVGVFFGATALVAALVINLHSLLMVASLAIFLSGLFIIIVACIFKLKS